MKTGSHHENTDFCCNLLNFYFLKNDKWHFWWQNYLELIYHNKHSTQARL